MKWVRFLDAGGCPLWGHVEDDIIVAHSGSPLEAGHREGMERLPLDSTPLLPPCTPSKIVCVGRNYRDHAKELGNEVPSEPLLFLKPPSALLAPGGLILLPALAERVDFEGELAVVIGRRCRALQPGAAIAPYLFGFTCLNDVTARDLQKKDGQWTRGKGFDTFCPVGPWVEDWSEQKPGGRARPWEELAVETRVNGELRQQGNTRDFIFSLDQVLVAITAVMTLEPGDLVATGTPAGVGPLAPGDRVSITIADLGTLDNTVASA